MKNLSDATCVEEVRSRIAALRPIDIGEWGHMTVGEMVCHLREAFTGAAGEPKWQLMLGAPLPPAMMRLMALKIPVQWPRNIETVPELKQGTVLPPSAWDADRVGLDGALGVFLACKQNHNPHPIFGAMKPWDWMRWGYLHADHHLRQFGR